MSLNQLHIVQASVFLPLLEELSQCGVNTTKLIKNGGLNRFALDSPNYYIPIPVLYRLLKEIKTHSNADLLHFSKALQIKCLSDLGKALCFAPNVLEACQLTEQHNESVLSNELVRIEILGSKTIYNTFLTDNYDEGWNDLELISLMYIINGLKMGGGNNWVPYEIHLKTSIMPNLDTLFPSNNSISIRLKQPNTKIVFDTKLLCNPLISKDFINDQKVASNILFESSNTNKVIHLLNSSKTGKIPSLIELASYSNTSVSTFKRMLGNEGNTYKEILDNWRFKKAITLLENPMYRVKEIAEILGYANTPNFERAFNRWANCTPEKYRLTLK